MPHSAPFCLGHQGTEVLKQTVPREDIGRMRQLSEQWHALDASELPAPLKTYRDPSTKPTRSIGNSKALFQVTLASRHRPVTRAGGNWGVMENRWSSWKCWGWSPTARIWTRRQVKPCKLLPKVHRGAVPSGDQTGRRTATAG